MMVLSDKDKSIKIDFNTPITQKEVITKKLVYTVTLPKITCSNEQDAIQIQTKVNEFVSTLTKNLLKNDKE